MSVHILMYIKHVNIFEKLKKYEIANLAIA